MTDIILQEKIRNSIISIRGIRVMIDRDLAKFYGAETKVLNQTVKRNIERFPTDFMFQLTKEEKEYVVTNCDHIQDLKYSYQSPYAFTEHGIAMLSSVLKSKKAIQINIAITRVFVCD